MEEEYQPARAHSPARRSGAWGIAAAIVVAGLMVASAFWATRTPSTSPVKEPPAAQKQGAIAIRPVSEEDHIRGDPNAPVVIVEYSDYECPFCAKFDLTMQKLMEKYGKEGKLAWVYRHFPIEQLHKKAWRIAIGSECVAEIAGNDAFWKYSDLVFAQMRKRPPGSLEFDMTLLSDYAEEAGASREAFNACMETGTPHNIIIAGGQMAAVPGAQPYDVLDQLIASILSGLGE